MTTDVLEILRTKRDGGTLSGEQIRFFLDGYTAGTIADEQAAALCMAIVWRGMDTDELATWTETMIASGERLDLSGVGRPTVDKHSTGGVGDTVSLVLCPLVAAFGVAVPQLSGRGLAHTGGTIDKMETIPGWRVQLTNAEIVAQLRDVGAVICSAGPGLVPADRKLYALRDVTATVEAIPLIASSIMAKKIAEGTQSLVLDVKIGAGAFLPELDRARLLAETMVTLGERAGVRTVALVTDMDAPLGRAAGNALEVAEAVEVLRGGGPPDLVKVTVALAEVMLELAGVAGVDAAAALGDGRALAVWDAMVRAQGGDPDAPLPRTDDIRVLTAPTAGYVQRLDARAVGVAAWRAGAGRTRKEDPVSPSAGVVALVKPGDRVDARQPVLELHVDDPARADAALAALAGALELGAAPPPPRPLIVERIG